MPDYVPKVAKNRDDITPGINPDVSTTWFSWGWGEIRLLTAPSGNKGAFYGEG